ncbi:MAG TPA: hypothetical protein VFO36_03930, partial [Nitrospiraceae bacterium]|nr:hypothetical protein [Nitrospiraceae bacterium]
TDIAAPVDVISRNNDSLSNLNSTATGNARLFQLLKAAGSSLADRSNRAHLWGLKIWFWRSSL